MSSPQPPNILLIMSDDHAAHAISAYGGRINQTPNLDRIAAQGMRFNHCYCTNSICTPSRANILTGQHSHINGVKTLCDTLDGRRNIQLQKLMRQKNYQSALFGKWHLGHGGHADPQGFDDWCVLPGQGEYHDPIFQAPSGERQYQGYVTDIITQMCLDWLDQRDESRPFMLMCHHKAPHRPWQPAPEFTNLYEDEDIPEPDTMFDDYATRSEAVRAAKMRLEDLIPETDLKSQVPPDLDFEKERQWRYQRYIKDYLRCVASIDKSVGRLLDWLDAKGLAENTLVIYTSDQGFFLGEHGWFDKRFMYEESFQMPLLMRYPRLISPGSVNRDMICNIDFAPTILELAGLPVPTEIQGSSALPLLQGRTPDDWQKSIYYRYWMHKDSIHNVCAHYGVCTHDYKLIHYYGKSLGCTGSEPGDMPPEWELYDRRRDPLEVQNVYHDPAYAAAVRSMTEELNRLQRQFHDKREH